MKTSLNTLQRFNTSVLLICALFTSFTYTSEDSIEMYAKWFDEWEEKRYQVYKEWQEDLEGIAQTQRWNEQYLEWEHEYQNTITEEEQYQKDERSEDTAWFESYDQTMKKEKKEEEKRKKKYTEQQKALIRKIESHWFHKKMDHLGGFLQPHGPSKIQVVKKNVVKKNIDTVKPQTQFFRINDYAIEFPEPQN